MAMSSLDDKLLGEKVENYCSSSEGEEDDDAASDAEASNDSTLIKSTTRASAPKGDGMNAQTGPKGVIEDWRRYKQFETEQREKDAAEKMQLHKKLSMTCKSFKEEQEEKAKEDDFDVDEEFLEWYKKKRILEIQQKHAARWADIAFGEVVELTHDSFVEAIENERKFVTIIIHIYDDDTPACSAVNGCMKVLAKKFHTIKFCRIHVAEAKVSPNFIDNGLPSIIVYKDNIVIGNFVRISDTLGDDFFAPELEDFLAQYGMLPSDMVVESA